MKAILIIFAVLTVALLMIPSQLDAQLTTRQCRRRVNNNCIPNGQVCVRNRRTNVCERYNNTCQQRLANCDRRPALRRRFRRVALRLCSGIAVNNLATCNSTATG